jgi:outer membrane lipoprotein-sorting protein
MQGERLLSGKARAAFFMMLFILLAGCTTTPERLVKKVAKTVDQLRGYYAEIDAVVFSLEGEQHYVVRQWFQSPSRWRVEVETEDDRQFFISNGEQVLVYQPDLGDYYRVGADFIQEIPPPFMLLTYLEQFIEKQSYTFGGKKKKERHTFYHVTYDVRESNERVQLWLDTKTLFPILVETYLDDELLNRLTCCKFEMNPEFTEDLFDINLQDEQEITSRCLIRPLSLEEARREWPLPVFVPSYLPPGTSLFVVSRGEEDGREQLMLIYNGKNSFTLIQREKEDGSVYQASGMEEVHINGATGVFQKNKMDETNTLWWSNETSHFILTGYIQMEDMIRVAESLTAE